jgi:hypothetical protein
VSISNTGSVRASIISTDNDANGAGVFFGTKNGGTFTGRGTIRTNNSGDMSMFTGTTGDALAATFDASQNTILAGTLTVNGGTGIENLTLNGGTGDTEPSDAVFALTKTSSTANVLAGKIRLESKSDAYPNMVFQVKTTASSSESDAFYTDAITIDGQTADVSFSSDVNIGGILIVDDEITVDGTGVNSFAGIIHADDGAQIGSTEILSFGGGSSLYLTEGGGSFGSVSAFGKRAGQAGYSIEDRVVFMHDGGDIVGIYDDVNNKFLFRGTFNGATEMYYSGNVKLATTNTGIDITGTTETDAIKITTGAVNNAVLTSDASGNGTWATSLNLSGSGTFGGNLTVGGGEVQSVVTKTSDYTLTGAERNILVDASANTVTISLDASPVHGQVYDIFCTDATFTCTVARNGNTINGAAADQTLLAAGSIEIQWDDSYGWFIKQ